MKKKIISIFILFFCIINSYSYGIYDYFPIWKEDISEVNANTIENSNNIFLNLESESAILIEQTTRKSSF